MKSTQFQKSFFSFFCFFILAFAAGCRSSQTRGEANQVARATEVVEVPKPEPDCLGLPAKNEHEVVANQGETTAQKPEETKQEVKTVPPIQKKTEVAQVPVKETVPTTQQKPQEKLVAQQQPSQVKNLLAQVQTKLAEAKKIGPGEKRQELLGEVKKLGGQIKTLAKGGDAEAITLRKGAPFKDAAQLYKQLRDEGQGQLLVGKSPEPKVNPQAKVEVGKKEVASDPVVRPEEKVSPTPKNEGEPTTPQTPTVPKDRKVPPGSTGMPTWVWGLACLLAAYILACLVSGAREKKDAARIAKRCQKAEIAAYKARLKADRNAAEERKEREKERQQREAELEERAQQARLEALEKQLADARAEKAGQEALVEVSQPTEETKKEEVVLVPAVANPEPPAAQAEPIDPKLAAVLEEDETAEEPVTADEKTQLGGGALAIAASENTTETPHHKEAGKPEKPLAVVEKKEAALLTEAEWQKLLAGIREAGMEYPANNPTLKRALEEAQTAEEAFGAACDELAAARKKPEAVRHEQAARKVAAAVQKANRWYLYWQEASYVVAGSDEKIYCQTKYGKAQRDLAKARRDQQQFETKPMPLQKKGGKKCRGKK